MQEIGDKDTSEKVTRLERLGADLSALRRSHLRLIAGCLEIIIATGVQSCQSVIFKTDKHINTKPMLQEVIT